MMENHPVLGAFCNNLFRILPIFEFGLLINSSLMKLTDRKIWYNIPNFGEKAPQKAAQGILKFGFGRDVPRTTEFESIDPYKYQFFQEKLTHLYTNRPNFGAKF